MARWVVALLVAMLVAVVSLGAQQASPASSNPDLQAVECSQRSIPLTVVKSSTPSWDWHWLVLTVGGRQVRIESMVATPRAPRVMVLVATSGSMGPGTG